MITVPLENISVEAKSVFSKLTILAEKENVKIYVVGGFVRDLMMKNEVEDIDVVVEGDAIHFAKSFRSSYGGSKVVSYGRFGTAMLNYKKYKLEFAAAREEYYTPQSRKPQVTLSHIIKHLSRRDFTINSMAIELNQSNFGELIDPFNGLADISGKIIRTPLDPEITFHDDPLRMLRAVRFASRLNFTINRLTLAAIGKMGLRLEIVSQERITEEFLKMISHRKPELALQMLIKSGLLAIILPELFSLSEIKNSKSATNGLKFSLHLLAKTANHTNDILMRLASLFLNIGGDASNIINRPNPLGRARFRKLGKRIKLPFKHVEKIAGLIYYEPCLRGIVCSDNYLKSPDLRKLMIHSADLFDDLLMFTINLLSEIYSGESELNQQRIERFNRLLTDVKSEENWTKFKLAVSGEEIMDQLKVTEGIVVGKIKQNLMDRIIKGEIKNSRKECLSFLSRLKAGSFE